MNNIAQVIEKYSVIGNSVTDVPSIVEWGATNSLGMGQSVNAKQLSANYIEGQETGEESEAGGLTSEWDTISKNKGGNSKYYYVRGHLLNAKVGGIVNNTNLTPLSGRANRVHHKEVEKHVKKIVTGKSRENDKDESPKGVVSYSVKAIYGTHPKRDHLKNLVGEKKRVKETEEMFGVIPVGIEFSLKKMMLLNGKLVQDTSFPEIHQSVRNELPNSVNLK
jgi:DNA/RNA non-specific endonuclease